MSKRACRVLLGAFKEGHGRSQGRRVSGNASTVQCISYLRGRARERAVSCDDRHALVAF